MDGFKRSPSIYLSQPKRRKERTDPIVSVHKCTFSVMPDLIRHPDVVPTKVGNHLKDWVPVFTGNPGFRLSPE
jgi:hypothetical protein